MVKRAVEMEGTVTGEHGVGLVKRDYLAHELGESTVDAMRKVLLTEDSPKALLTILISSSKPLIRFASSTATRLSVCKNQNGER